MSESRRTRVRFEDMEYEEFPSSRCKVVVRLEWAGRQYVGEASGMTTREGKLLTGARAALQAIERTTEGRLALSLVGIKAIRAFDGWVIVASVFGRSEPETYKLLGAQATDEGGTLRGSVLTMLDATNRIIEKYLEAG